MEPQFNGNARETIDAAAGTDAMDPASAKNDKPQRDQDCADTRKTG
jgi:hypothetical protein